MWAKIATWRVRGGDGRIWFGIIRNAECVSTSMQPWEVHIIRSVNLNKKEAQVFLTDWRGFCIEAPITEWGTKRYDYVAPSLIEKLRPTYDAPKLLY
jgi:hypothetical protein